MTNDAKAQALLASPVGCALILDLSANSHLPLEYFAQPKVSFWLAASAIDFMDPYSDGSHQYHQEWATRDAANHADLALQIVSHPAFAWWYEPVDLANQVWVSPRMPHGPDPDPLVPFDSKRWGKPAPPHPDYDSPVPTSWQTTSTLRGASTRQPTAPPAGAPPAWAPGGSTCQITAFAIGAADFICDFPLAAWQIRFHRKVRVHEINHPADWHALCLEYPHQARDGRLLPNWPAVSEHWDGIHLTLGGMLSCEQARCAADGQWSMLQYWHAEQTHWLNPLQITGSRMPDVQRSPQWDEWDELARYPYSAYDPAAGNVFWLRRQG